MSVPMIKQETLQEYFDLEAVIIRWKNENIVQSLDVALKEREQLLANIDQLTPQIQQQTDKVSLEKADVDVLKLPTTRELFASSEEFDEKMAKEKHEYMEAVNKLETLTSQLESAREKLGLTERQIGELKAAALKLGEAGGRQDAILHEIFGNAYGSEEEERLEAALDTARRRCGFIQATKTKWESGRVYVYYSVNQLADAVNLWRALSGRVGGQRVGGQQMGAQRENENYRLATECRNNLIAAAQNFRYCQGILSHIALPYFQADEIAALEHSAHAIYSFAFSADTSKLQSHLDYWVTCHQRAFALIQWVDRVLVDQIHCDLRNSEKEVQSLSKDLRAERARLMKERATPDLIEMITREEKKIDASAPEEQQEKRKSVDKADSDADASKDTSKIAEPKVKIKAAEIPVGPSKEELFGELSKITEQHRNVENKLDSNLEEGKQKAERDLKERLSRRKAFQIKNESIQINSLLDK